LACLCEDAVVQSFVVAVENDDAIRLRDTAHVVIWILGIPSFDCRYESAGVLELILQHTLFTAGSERDHGDAPFYEW
jgi:hypothetical protein